MSVPSGEEVKTAPNKACGAGKNESVSRPSIGKGEAMARKGGRRHCGTNKGSNGVLLASKRSGPT